MVGKESEDGHHRLLEAVPPTGQWDLWHGGS